MDKNERQHEIIAILKKEGYTTVEKLSQLLYASPSSIRRDLIQLEKAHLVTRSYGGVELYKTNSKTVPFSASVQRRVPENKIIAEKAASLVRDGDIVFLDHSSCCLFLAQELAKEKSITVMTNSIEILSIVGTDSRITLYACGGKVSQSLRCFNDIDAAAQFRKLHADIAFFSADALTSNGVIYDSSIDNVYVRESMMRNAVRKVFLCDSEKFGKTAGYKQCELRDIDYLISDVDCKERFQRFSQELIIL